MMNLDQVETIRQTMTAEGAAKPEIIRQLALACIGWPYVFGAWGEECTPANRKRRARAEHPTIVSACQCLRDTNRKASCDGCKWYPDGYRVRMYDCRGFPAWLLRQVGLDIYGDGATTQYNTARNWVMRGKIADGMPDVVCCVFRQKNGKMEHTGMHLGGGVVVDCSVNVRSVGMKGWTHYAVPCGLYSEGEIPMDVIKPTLRKGDKGEAVKDLQEALNKLGYDCGSSDGIFGTKTKDAVERFQKALGLSVDGIVGRNTWKALDAATGAVQPPEIISPQTFRVTIDGVTYEQYRRILEICPLAEAEKEN